MELALYSIFTIDTRSLAKNKLHICKEYNYSPDYIDKMPFYEYEWLIQDINEILLREFEEKEIGEIVENEGRKAKVIKKIRKFGKNYLHCIYI